MHKLLLLSPLLALLCTCGRAPENASPPPKVIATDVVNFWKAYDQVILTQDSATQADLLETEFFAKGTPGLAAIMEARGYSKEEYRQAINAYPKFWASIRNNMLRAPEMGSSIATAAQALFDIYPQQLPAEVYFTVGCFRTNGTIVDSLLLIGTELAMAGPKVDLTEWPARLAPLRPYMESNPLAGLVLLNTHEFVHTQQPVRNGYNLLGEVLFEGVAEFMATLALNQPSTTPAIAFGEANLEKVKAAFVNDLGNPFYSNWLQNDTDNEFKMRDLGYYVGFAMVKQYYDTAQDKPAAIKTLIEFDYQDSVAVNTFVDQLGFFDRPVADYLADYLARRPVVTHTTGIGNGAKEVNPATTAITFHLSQPINTYYRSTDYGPLGAGYLPNINGAITAEDGRSVTYQVRLEPGRRYQFTLGTSYQTEAGMRLVPYTIDFETQK